MNVNKHKLLAILVASVTLTACGGDDSGDDGADTTSASADTTAGPTTNTTPPTTTTDDPSTTTDDPSTTTDDPSTTTDDPDTTTGTAACTTDVCATYGAAVPLVVSQIVDEAAVDPLFMEDFAPLVAAGPKAVDAFKASLTAFISDAYGCTSGTYTGPTMEDAHAGMGITQDEYDAFIGLIAGVLASNGVPEEDINLCFAPPLVDPAFVATIVGQ
jgi:truncated hemoglobin YjbI